MNGAVLQGVRVTVVDRWKQCHALLSADHLCSPYNLPEVKLPLTVFLMSGVKILE